MSEKLPPHPDPEIRRAHREALWGLSECAAELVTEGLKDALDQVRACVLGNVPDCGMLPCGFPCFGPHREDDRPTAEQWQALLWQTNEAQNITTEALAQRDAAVAVIEAATELRYAPRGTRKFDLTFDTLRAALDALPSQYLRDGRVRDPGLGSDGAQ